ncbi:hypothetical protein [Bacteroides sp.]
MQALLTNIELDIQELKYLMDAFSREPNAPLRELLKRNILQMSGRLDQLLLELDVVEKSAKELLKPVQIEKEAETEPIEIEETTSVEVETHSPMMESQTQIIESRPPIEIQIKEVVQLSSAPILGERIRPVTDLRRSISLNDSFRFSRELFNGDSEQMNRAIEQISEMSSLDAAVAFLLSKTNVDEENEAMNDMIELLKKYFN